MVKATGKYLLATGSDTDWANILSNWGLTFSQLNNCIYDISGIPFIDDVSLNTNNLNKIDISAKVPQLSPFRAYWVDISGIIEDYTIFYMTEDASYNINEFYIDDIIGRTSYDSDISENNIRAVTMAQAVTTIAEQTFASLPNLTRVNIPKTVTTIGSEAFYDCSNLLAVTFEENSQLNTIGEGAFQGTTNLSAITIPSGVTSIGVSAFEFAAFTSITIPSGVTTLSEGVFANMPNLTTVTFEADSSLNIIGNSVFSSSENLTSITIPSGVTSIGESAFTSTTSLTSISIPPLVTSIGTNAFIGCSTLSQVTFTGDMIPEDISLNTFPPKSQQNITAYYTQDLSQNYIDILKATFSNVTNSEMSKFTLQDNSVVQINIHGPLSQSSYSSQISDITTIIEIDIGNNVTSIEDSAFNGANNLTFVTIPQSVTSIESNAFSNSGLNTVNMTESTSAQLGLPAWYDYTVSPPTGPNGEQSMEVQSLFGLNNYSFFGATNVNIYHPILLGL